MTSWRGRELVIAAPTLRVTFWTDNEQRVCRQQMPSNERYNEIRQGGGNDTNSAVSPKPG